MTPLQSHPLPHGPKMCRICMSQPQIVANLCQLGANRFPSLSFSPETEPAVPCF